mmetsp:Transcript_19561/g.27451  ORF Transcript_19561/g.27451 Transcript_19561/m.27451 type:complete len:167 (+) Transcript_19561:25-525(+)
MFRVFARSAARFQKMTTGLSGIPVVPNSREVLISLYNKTLAEANGFLAQDDVEFNRHVIKLTNWRLNVVKSTEDLAEIEEKVNCGQMEELIEQAENELELLYAMNLDFRLWEEDADLAAKEFALWKDDSFGEPQEQPDVEDFEKYDLTKGLVEQPPKPDEAEQIQS